MQAYCNLANIRLLLVSYWPFLLVYWNHQIWIEYLRHQQINRMIKNLEEFSKSLM